MAGNESYDWSSLPSDLVHLISTKLHDLSDLVRLRAVCKTWRLAVNPLLNPLSPCLPWFVACNAMDDGTDKICYYSLSSNKTYKIQLPQPQPKDAYFLSVAGGRLLCWPDHKCRRSPSLFNPLTGLSISLPNLEDDVTYLTIVSSNLLQEEIVAISGHEFDSIDSFVSVIRPGDEAWVPIPVETTYYTSVCVYHEGLFYINSYEHKYTWIINTIGEMVANLPCHEMFNGPISDQHILESNGEILVILRHFSRKLEDASFSIFRLDHEVNGDYQWVKVRDVGDRILFLHYATGFSLPSNDFSGFKGNCIYFLEEESFQYSRLENEYSKSPTVLLRRHDLENGATENLPNFFNERGTWFFPKLF